MAKWLNFKNKLFAIKILVILLFNIIKIVAKLLFNLIHKT